MRPFAEHIRSWSFLPVAFGLSMFMLGCNTRTTPPSPDTISWSGPAMAVTYLQWKDGMMLLLVDDIHLGGSHHSGGSGTTNNPIYTGSGSVKAADGRGYQWQIETTDGKAAKFKIDGKDYDLSNGALFVMNTKGERIEVHQLKRDLSAIPFDAKKAEDSLKKDAEVMKLLATGELPK